MNSNRFILQVAAACFCFLPLQPASAQMVYKSTMPDGRVEYGDKPVPGAVKVQQTRPDTSKKGIEGATAREKELQQGMAKERLQREQKAAKVQAAEQKLKEAEAARAAGKEPLPGERIGTAGGASRLTTPYFDRQRKLQEAVEKARRELDELGADK